MKLDPIETNEFTNPQQLMNLIGWMLQGLNLDGSDNSKLVRAYHAILQIFND